jgi:hypothetical protein
MTSFHTPVHGIAGIVVQIFQKCKGLAVVEAK